MIHPMWKRKLLLGAIHAAEGEWLARADLAMALNKPVLSSSDVSALRTLQHEGIIDMERRQRNKQHPRSYFYRARPVK